MKIKLMDMKDFNLLKRAVKYIIPYRLKFILAFLCILSGVGVGILQPLIWGNMVTALFQKNFDTALQNVLYISILYIFQSCMSFFQAYLFSFLGNNIIFDLKRDMYKKVLSMPVKAFDDMRVGEFMSRLHGDTSAIANIITNQLLNTIVDILKVIIIGVTVFAISLPLSLIVLISFPISYFIFLKSAKVLRSRNEELVKLNDDYFSKLQQSLAGIREIKSLGIKEKYFDIFGESAQKVRDKNVGLSIIGTLAQTISQGVNFASQIAVMSFGGYLTFKGMLSMQHYIAFSSYTNQFSSALMNITQLNANIQQALTSLERIFGLMDNLSYEMECEGDKCITNIEGNIKFDNVSFQYNNKITVLKDISFEIMNGRKTAIVGISGSGKTTILNLLLRFYQPTEGKIFIDDIDIKEYSEKSLRTNVSIVRQDPFLFNMSIRENLLLANPHAADKELHKACKVAYIHDYIMGLPEKYDSIIGENGVNLSGGQKQRIAIARALLKESKIILFDEATSSLDNESQYYIRMAIDELSKNHTLIIIAHRLFTVIEADKIIVLDKGEIVGYGSHNTLIDESPIYKRLYETEIDVLMNSKREVS